MRPLPLLLLALLAAAAAAAPADEAVAADPDAFYLDPALVPAHDSPIHLDTPPLVAPGPRGGPGAPAPAGGVTRVRRLMGSA